MRGSAVPTIVWSSAARKSASMTPTVTRTSRRPWISPDNSSLLLRGWGDEDVVDIGDGGAQARLLLGREPFEDPGQRGGHEVAHALELDLAGVGERDHERAPIGRIVDPPDESVGDEPLDDLAQRQRGRPAEQGDLTGADRAAAVK